MKTKLLLIITAAVLLAFPNVNYSQVIVGANAARFALFTASGTVGDNAVAHSNIIGDVGTLTTGPITGFGNVNGVMHPGTDLATTACVTDLNATIAQINALPATLVGPLALGSGYTVTPGVWSIPGNATLTLDLFIDGQNNPNSQFIIKVAGTFSTNTLSRVKLINGALACNIFWQINGAVTMAALSTMRGNVITGGAILMGSGDSLEGRMFVTPAGSITIDGIHAFMPIGCGSTVLTGPAFPTLGTTECYEIFTSNGALANTPVTTSIGDVGTNGGGTVTGWTPAEVTGTLHLIQDPSTIQCATDVSNLYTALLGLPYDIELLFPAQFGHNLILTPHVYLMNGATTFTDSLYLDAQNNPNGVFVIKIIGGAMTTSTYSKVKLLNGAQSKNVFWLVQGAVNINNYSVFRGTIVVGVGAINLVNTGVVLDGRALTMNGAITTAGLAGVIPSGSAGPAGVITGPASVCKGQTGVTFSVPAVSGASGYIWALSPGATITSGANTNSITVTFSGTAASGTVTVQGSASCNNGTVSSTFSVTVNSLPIVVANPSAATICAGSSVTLTGSGATTYVWTGGVTNGIGFVPTSTNTYTVTGTDGNSCSATATTTVNVNSTPTVTANASSTTLCSGSSTTLTGSGATSYIWTGGVMNGIGFTPTSTNTYTLTGTNASGCTNTATVTINVNSSPTVTVNASATTVCSGSSVTLSGSGATSYVWTGGVINGIGFVPTSTNTYTVTGTNASGCSKTATVTINVNSSPTVTVNASASTVCLGSTVTLTGSGATTYVWSGGVINGVGFVPTSTNTYTVTGTNASGCSNTATVTINVNSSPTVTVNASATTVCSGSSVTLTGNGATSYVWSGGVIDGIGFIPTSTNTYTVTGTNASGCSNTATVTINVNSSPTVTVNASATTVCSGSSVTLTGSGATSYVWSGGVINGLGFVPSSTNTYTVTGTNGGLCSGTATITVVVNPIPVAVANSNSPVCMGSPINLTAQTIAGGTYSWTGPNGFVSASQDPTINPATGTGGGTYTLTVSSNGCSSAPATTYVGIDACDSIHSKTDFFIPEGFSPNGDGINDLFVIRGILNFPNNTFEIFNRWGNKVFDASPYTNTWDGKSTMGLRVGGDDLPIGTYFYVLDLHNGTAIYKGTIYLNR